MGDNAFRPVDNPTLPMGRMRAMQRVAEFALTGSHSFQAAIGVGQLDGARRSSRVPKRRMSVCPVAGANANRAKSNCR
jgi:hypothetical protein